MASAFTHAFSAVALGSLWPAELLPRRVWIAGALCAALPDLDVLLHWSGVPYDHMFGHRGFTHSVFFALVLAAVVTWCARGWRDTRGRAVSVWAYLALCTASHGVLDAMTDGGMGIAFFAPFSDARYFLPWEPIRVAPIGIAAFFSEYGWRVMQSEFRWVWAPGAVLIVIAVGTRRLLRRRRPAEAAD